MKQHIKPLMYTTWKFQVIEEVKYKLRKIDQYFRIWIFIIALNKKTSILGHSLYKLYAT